jgi:hypothetical protein
MLLEELHWEGPQTIEDLNTWGIDPILDQLERFDEYCQPTSWGQISGEEDPVLVYFYYELRHKVERLQRAIYRLFGEAVGEKDSPAE